MKTCFFMFKVKALTNSLAIQQSDTIFVHSEFCPLISYRNLLIDHLHPEGQFSLNIILSINVYVEYIDIFDVTTTFHKYKSIDCAMYNVPTYVRNTHGAREAE